MGSNEAASEAANVSACITELQEALKAGNGDKVALAAVLVTLAQLARDVNRIANVLETWCAMNAKLKDSFQEQR